MSEDEDKTEDGKPVEGVEPCMATCVFPKCEACEACYTCQTCIESNVPYMGGILSREPVSVEEFARAEKRKKRKEFLMYLITFKWIKFK